MVYFHRHSSKPIIVHITLESKVRIGSDWSSHDWVGDCAGHQYCETTGCVWNHSCAGPPHRPLTPRVFVWPADPSIGPPLWVPGPWMLYHCFLWEAGNWMTGYLLQQHPVLEKSSLHSYPPIILLSPQHYARGHPGGFWWAGRARLTSRQVEIDLPIQMFPSKFWIIKQPIFYIIFQRLSCMSFKPGQ